MLSAIASLAVAVTWPGSTATPAPSEVQAVVERHSPCAEPTATCRSVEFAIESGPDTGQLVAIDFDLTADESLGRDALVEGDVVRLRADRAPTPSTLSPATYDLIGTERSLKVVALLAAALGGLAVIAGVRSGRAIAAFTASTALVMLYALPNLRTVDSGSLRQAVIVGATVTLIAAALALAADRRPRTHLALVMSGIAGATAASFATSWLALADPSGLLLLVGGLSSLAVVGFRRSDAAHLLSGLLLAGAVVVPVLAVLVAGSGAGLDDPSLAALAVVLMSVAIGVVVDGSFDALAAAIAPVPTPAPAPVVLGPEHDDFVIDLRPAVRRENPAPAPEPEPVPTLLGKLRAGLDD